jgi:hypothetical protein
MQLRDRKAKAPIIDDVAKASSRADRRRTIAAVADLPDPGASQNGVNSAGVGIASSRPRRRSSAGSSILSAFESMNLNDRSTQPQDNVSVTSGRSSVATQKVGRPPTLPSKPAKATVQRKPKQPSNTKVQPIKAKTSPRKAGPEPPVPRIATAVEKHSNIVPQESLQVESEGAQSTSTLNGSENTADDLDSISSGMKKMKINLKVPSPEENAAREKKAVEEREKPKKPRAPRKLAIPKPAKATATKKTAGPAENNLAMPSNTPELLTTNGQSEANPKPVDFVSSALHPEQQSQSRHSTAQGASADDYIPRADIAHAEPPMQTTIPAPVPAPMQTETIASLDPPSEETPQGSQVSASNKPEAERVLSSPPLPPQPERNHSFKQSTSVAPASAPATAKKTRADLPQFTASSPIPFARAAQPLRATDPEVEAPAASSDAADSGITPGQQPAKGNNIPQSHPPPKLSSTTTDPSIWEVPETPQR